MKKQPELTDATRQLIADAFWDLLKDHPVDRSTVAMVVERAHVHRSTFYRYYHDVFEILEQYEAETLDTMIEQFQWIVDHVGVTDLGEVIRHLESALYQKKDTILLLRLRSVDGRFIRMLKLEMKECCFPLFGDSYTEMEQDFLFEHFFSMILTNMSYLSQHDEGVIDTMRVLTEQLMKNGIYSMIEKANSDLSV